MKFKRILAAVLSTLMLISAMSFTAMADETEATLDDSLALSNLLINYDTAGSNYPQYKHFGVDAAELASSEITITLPYGWDTSLVPQPGTYADVTKNGNPKNMVIVPVVTEGTAVYSAPATLDGTGKIRIASADGTKYKDIDVKFEIGSKPSDLSADVTNFSVVSGDAIDKTLTKTGTFHEVASTHYTPNYSSTGYLNFEGYAIGMFTRPYHLSSYKQYRALVYYDTGADKAFDVTAKFGVAFGTYAFGNLDVTPSESYKGNRWEYVYVTIPESSWGWIMQERFRFFSSESIQGKSLTDDSVYIAEFKLLADGDEKFQQYRPVDLEVTLPVDGVNGAVSNVTSDMEYKLASAEEWTAVNGATNYDTDTATLSGLDAGTYEFRYAARNESYDPSPATTVDVRKLSVTYTGVDGTALKDAVEVEAGTEIAADDMPSLSANQYWFVDGELVSFPYVVEEDTAFTVRQLADLSTKYAGYDIIYVRPADQTGSETQPTAVSFETPYLGTLAAFKKFAASDNSKVVLALIGDYNPTSNVSFTSNGANADVVLTSAYTTPVTAKMGGKFLLDGSDSSFTVDNLNFYIPTNNWSERGIIGKGWNVTVGDNINVESQTNTDASRGFYVTVGSDGGTGTAYIHENDNDEMVYAVYSGEIQTVRGGADGGSQINNNVHYIIGKTENAKDVIISTLNLAGQGSASKAVTTRIVNGDITADINSGTVSVLTTSQRTLINGNVYINVNGGTVSRLNMSPSNAVGDQQGAIVVGYHDGEITALDLYSTSLLPKARERVLVANMNDEDIAAQAIELAAKTYADSENTENLLTSTVLYFGDGKAEVEYAEGSAYNGTVADGVTAHKNTVPQLTFSLATATKVFVNHKEYSVSDTVVLDALTNGTETATADQLIDETEYVVAFGEDVYKLTFDVDGTKTVVYANGEYLLPAIPAKDGFVTDGWYNGTTKVEGTTITLTADTVLTAKYVEEVPEEYSVSYTLEYDGSTVEPKEAHTVTEGTAEATITVAALNALLESYPAQAGYKWVWEANDIEITGDSYTVVADTVFEAVQTPITYTITFDANGGTIAGEATKIFTGLSYGDEFPAVDTPVFEGYDFGGWGETPETVTENGTYTAYWNIKKFTVTFDANGGKWTDGDTTKTVENVEYNTVATAPAENPELDDFTFEGWENISTPITADTTIKAIWEKVIPDPQLFAAIFMNGDTVVSQKDYEIDAEITAPDDPEPAEGYIFKGWAYESTTDILTFPQIMGTADVTYVAIFEEVEEEPTLEEKYAGYTIYYLYTDGTATTLGGTKDAEVVGLRAAVKKYAVDGAKVVFALVDDYTETANDLYENGAADFVITSAGGNIIGGSRHIRFSGTRSGTTTIPAKITIENIDVNFTSTDRTIAAVGADLTINNVTLSGNGAGLVVAEGWSSKVSVYRNVEFNVKNIETGFSLNAFRSNGGIINGNITYNISDNAKISSVYIGGAGGTAPHAPATLEGETSRVTNGDITANISSGAAITNLHLATAGVINGNVYYNIDGGTVAALYTTPNNVAGKVYGNVVINYTGGKISAIMQVNTTYPAPDSVVLITPSSLKHSFQAGKGGITKAITYGEGGTAKLQFVETKDGDTYTSAQAETDKGDVEGASYVTGHYRTAPVLVLESTAHTKAELFDADGKKIGKTITLENGKATVALTDAEYASLASVGFGQTAYDISYEYEDGTPIEGTITSLPVGNDGISAVSMPTPADKTGYTFDGWYVNGDKVDFTVSAYTVTADTTFVAKYTVNKYDVKFYELGDTVTEISGTAKEMEYGQALEKADMPAPADTNYEYKWYGDESKQTEVTFPVTVTDNVSFYAEKVEKTYTISFYSEDNSETPVYTVDLGLTNPEISAYDEEKFPAKVGHTIKLYAGGAEITLPYTATDDTDITVVYAANSYTVAYKDAQGDDVAAAAAMTYGTVVAESDMPSVEMPADKNTLTWKINGNAVEFPYIITGETTFVAEFTKVGYTVTFKVNGGKWADDTTADIVVTATENAPVDAAKIPANPTRDGFEFLGWDKDITEAITADFAVFTAQWKEIIYYTVTFDANGGVWADDTTENKTVQVAEGKAPSSIPAAPAKSGYRFLGWDKDIPTAVTEAVTLTAQWELITMENTYVGYDIYYLYKDGTATTLGGTKDAEVVGLRAAVKKYAVDGAKVVFVLVDDYDETSSNMYENGAADFVITSAGGVLYTKTYHIRFAGTPGSTNTGSEENPVTIPAKITIENITIESARSDGDATIAAVGADLTINNVILSGKPMGAVIGEGWSWFKTVNRDVELNVKNVASGLSINAFRSNGGTINGNITYNLENAQVSGLTAGGAGKTADAEDRRVVNGDITVNLDGSSEIDNLILSTAGVVNGNLYYNINGGTVTTLRTTSSAAIGKAYGNIVVNYTGGTIGAFVVGHASAAKPNGIILVSPASLEHSFTSGKNGITKTVTYSGDGVAKVRFVEEENSEAVTVAEGSGLTGHKRTSGKLVLESDTATVAYVTAGGVTKIYDLVNANEIVLASEDTNSITIDLPEGDVIVVFGDGVTATFKASTADGAVEDKTEVVYGVEGAKVTAPEVSDNKTAHRIFLGWAREGTTDILTFPQTLGAASVTYVAIFGDEPTYDIIVGGNIVVEDGYEGEATYTLPALENTETTRFLGYATTQDATTPEYFAGDVVTLGSSDLELFEVWKTKGEEDAEYQFTGRYDYSEKAYVIEMFYKGPEANTAAFGIAYSTDIFTSFEVAYTDAVQSTGTVGWEDGEKVDAAGTYVDAVYAKDGAFFGSSNKELIKLATITAAMAEEKYAEFAPETDLTKYIAAESIGTVFDKAEGEWLYIMNGEGDAIDKLYPIYFSELENNDTVTVTDEGKRDTSTFTVTSTDDKMNKDITFTVSDSAEVPFEVSYKVDGVTVGGLAENEGVYTIPAAKVLGNVTVVFKYGYKIESVEATGVTAPVYNEAPTSEVTVPTDAYYKVKDVKWTYGEGEVLSGSFGFDTVYTVEITLEPTDDNHIFAAAATYTLDGDAAEATLNEDGTVTIKRTYPATEKELGYAEVTVNLIRDENDAAYNNFAKVEFINQAGEAAVTLVEAEEAGAGFTVKADGDNALLAGVYTVRVSKNGYLAYETEITVNYKETATAEVTLTAGNVYAADGSDDSIINSDDFTRVTDAFTGETALAGDELTAYRALVDIDEDGLVTIFDLAKVKASFGETGAGYSE